MQLLIVSVLLLSSTSGLALQIQCYQCEETTHDCSTADFIVNCTVNVQDMCQKEVLVKEDGIHYRKSCASSGACLIASSGYQQFCTGKLHSVCITCCTTPLCNGPRQKKRAPPSAAPPLTTPQLPVFSLGVVLLQLLLLRHTHADGYTHTHTHGDGDADDDLRSQVKTSSAAGHTVET
ncbi:ly6/PLAUR domain-containing protein 1 [Cynoglossus semilaevis]|uniref:ly6/PLAUR domain-containing protein 1 n=1 Tax=Cynoglossus semilaevis TaxID=244447 RepID=UPI0004976798|nr:ly6/PLAUR domain-containing protein 1 [Cynoglossus semilaevis]